MRLLQRSILFELLRVFAFLLSVLTVLLLFVGIFREVTESGLGPYQVIQILPFLVPSLLPFTLPATLLLTVTVVYGRIAGDQEITAAKAAGINVLSLLWPSFLLGAVLSLGSLVLTDQLIPWAVGHIQRTVTAAMEDIFLDVLRKDHAIIDKRHGFEITVMGVEDRTLILPTFEYAPAGRKPVTIQAQEATLDFDLEQKQVMLRLRHGHFDSPGRQRVTFEEEEFAFPLPKKIKGPKPRHMSIRSINQQLRKLAYDDEFVRQSRDIETALALAVGDFDRLLEDDLTESTRQINFIRGDVSKLKTEIHSRFALASSCLCFTLLGAPFSVWQARRQFLTNFGLCFGPILAFYYPLELGMMNLSKTGLVDPAWAVWVGNGLLVAMSLFVLVRVLKH